MIFHVVKAYLIFLKRAATKNRPNVYKIKEIILLELSTKILTQHNDKDDFGLSQRVSILANGKSLLDKVLNN